MKVHELISQVLADRSLWDCDLTVGLWGTTVEEVHRIEVTRGTNSLALISDSSPEVFDESHHEYGDLQDLISEFNKSSGPEGEQS